MDPNEALRLAAEALREHRNRDAEEHLDDYREWRRSGGFQPRGGDKKARRIREELSARFYDEDEEADYIASQRGDSDYALPRRIRGLGKAESSCDALPALLDRAEVAAEVGDVGGVRQALADYTDTRIKRRCKGPIPSRFFELESRAEYSTVYGSGGQVLTGLRGSCEDAQREAVRALRAAKTPAQRRAAQKFMKRVKSSCGLGRLRGRRLRRKR